MDWGVVRHYTVLFTVNQGQPELEFECLAAGGSLWTSVRDLYLQV